MYMRFRLRHYRRRSEDQVPDCRRCVKARMLRDQHGGPHLLASRSEGARKPSTHSWSTADHPMRNGLDFSSHTSSNGSRRQAPPLPYASSANPYRTSLTRTSTASCVRSACHWCGSVCARSTRWSSKLGSVTSTRHGPKPVRPTQGPMGSSIANCTIRQLPTRLSHGNGRFEKAEQVSSKLGIKAYSPLLKWPTWVRFP